MDNPFTFRAARTPPEHDDVDAHRRHVKRTLAASFRLFARQGINLGVAGHITARDPGHADRFWVNPFGVPFGAMRARDLSLVGHDGTLLEGAPVNAAAFAIHAEIHRMRPDVMCAAHAHPVHGCAWATAGRLLDPISQDACAFYGDHVVFEEPMGLVLDLAEGTRIARALGARKAAILRNHGLLTVGRTVDEAAWWFVLMERCCQIQLLSRSVADASMLPAEQASQIAAQIGTPEFGWFQCQPLLAEILGARPDDLD